MLLHTLIQLLCTLWQADFLKFVTSCSRQPLLGFEFLVPPLCIQKVPLDAEGHKLPTSATCMNLFKLPGKRIYTFFVLLSWLLFLMLIDYCDSLSTLSVSFSLQMPSLEYRDRETMREKIIYAISANAGFEMS